jgi:hypothetical protein
MNQQAEGSRNTFDQQIALARLKAQLEREARNEEREKNASERESAQAERDKELRWRKISGYAKAFARDVRGAANTLATNLMGFGSFFGLMNLAGTANNWRRESMGLGTTSGQMLAFRNSFSRLVDPDAFMGRIGQMETDVTQQGSMYALLGHGATNNTARDAIDMLRAQFNLAHRTDTNLLGATFRAYGLDTSPEEQRRMKAMTREELEQRIANYEKAQKELGARDKVLRQWLDFSGAMEKARWAIESTFIQGLVRLTPGLTRLSGEVTGLVRAFMKSDLVQDAITGLGRVLNHWADALKDGKGEEKIKEILSRTTIWVRRAEELIKAMVDALPDAVKVLHALAHPVDAAKDAWHDLAHAQQQKMTAAGLMTWGEWFKYREWRQGIGGPKTATEYRKVLGDLDKDSNLLRGLFRQAGGSLDTSKRADGGLGVLGMTQAAADEVGINPLDPMQAALGARALIEKSLTKYKDPAIASEAALYGTAAVDAAARAIATNPVAAMESWNSPGANHLSRQVYSTHIPQIRVTVHTTPGADAVGAMATAAAGP